MRDRIAKNAQANRGINVARDIIPLLKISECVALGGLHVLHVLHVIANEARDLAQAGRTFSVL
jgi:hypothetical protein